MTIMKVDVMLHSTIYDVSTVQKAIKAYKSFANIEFDRQNDYILCSVSDCVYDKEITIKEFLNYLIDLLNQVAID